MSTIVEVTIRIAAPDGSPQLYAQRSDMTINPLINDWDAEAAVAKSTLDRLVTEAQEQIESRLPDWASALKGLNPSGGGG